MSRHTLHGLAASDLARLEMAERHRTAGRTRIAHAGRWQPARDGATLSARPGFHARGHAPKPGIAG